MTCEGATASDCILLDPRADRKNSNPAANFYWNFCKVFVWKKDLWASLVFVTPPIGKIAISLNKY